MSGLCSACQLRPAMADGFCLACSSVPPEQFQIPLTGRYVGPKPTETERASGEQVEVDNQGPMKPGKAGHKVLAEYREGERLTAYDASLRACGDYHAMRRESTRLLRRQLLVKDGTLPNRAPRGRDQVDAYKISDDGRSTLEQLDALASGE